MAAGQPDCYHACPARRRGQPTAGKEGHYLEVSKAAKDGKYGFTVQGKFHSFAPRFLNAQGSFKSPLVQFDALGGQWELEANKCGMLMRLLKGPDFAGKRIVLQAGASECPILGDLPIKHLFKEGQGPGYGFDLRNVPHQEALTQLKHMDLESSFPLSFTLLFAAM